LALCGIGGEDACAEEGYDECGDERWMDAHTSRFSNTAAMSRSLNYPGFAPDPSCQRPTVLAEGRETRTALPGIAGGP
jgi:hypothetical protein